MSVSSLIQRVAAYQRRYKAQTETASDFIGFLRRNQQNSFQRSLQEGHITASCWLLNTAQTHVLLTHHKKFNRWIQLGGHADGESDVHKVALTEATEESSIANIRFLLGGEVFDIDKHWIAARKGEPAHFHYDIRFAMQSVDSDVYRIGNESHDLRWVAIDHLSQFTDDESVLRMGNKWRRYTATQTP